jgi:hypothetical protein
MKNLKEFVAAIIENGGATYNLANGGTVDKGYMVSKKGLEMKFQPEVDVTQAVCQFIKEFGFELYEVENFMGAWIDEGVLYLDVSNNFAKRSDAIREGYKNEQLAIFDVVAQESLYLPTPQKTGTMTQQQSFINFQIDNL